MLRRTVSVYALLALLAPVVAMAQEKEEEAAPPFAYGTYFECDATREWLADKIVEQALKPVYDSAVDDGSISAWGYLAHHTGGKWRRVIYHIAPTLDGVFEALDTINEKVAKASADAADELGKICSSHDDYVWRFVAGSGVGGPARERGKVGFSVYFICDESRETRADEIVKETIAPIYDAQVEAGEIVSWGWMEHLIGGKYRRIATTTAKDRKTLLAARGAALEKILANEAVSKEFNEICGSHSDYIWNVKFEKP